MFNLFKRKKKSTTSVNIPFLQSFSEDQKAAMIYTLLLIVGSEGSYDEKQMEYTMKQANLLEFSLESRAMSVYQQKNADHAYSVLRQLSEKQKGWYSVLLGSLLSLNGRPTERELGISQRIIEQCGISEETFNHVNSMAQAITEKFNS